MKGLVLDEHGYPVGGARVAVAKLDENNEFKRIDHYVTTSNINFVYFSIYLNLCKYGFKFNSCQW